MTRLDGSGTSAFRALPLIVALMLLSGRSCPAQILAPGGLYGSVYPGGVVTNAGNDYSYGPFGTAAPGSMGPGYVGSNYGYPIYSYPRLSYPNRFDGYGYPGVGYAYAVYGSPAYRQYNYPPSEPLKALFGVDSTPPGLVRAVGPASTRSRGSRVPARAVPTGPAPYRRRPVVPQP